MTCTARPWPVAPGASATTPAPPSCTSTWAAFDTGRPRPAALPARLQLLPAGHVLVDVGHGDDVHPGVDDRRGRLLARLHLREDPDRLRAPAEILLAEEHLDLALAQQVGSGRDGVEGDELRARRIHRLQRVAREDGPASDRDPRPEVGIAAAAGGDDVRAADRVFLDVVDLADLHGRMLGEDRAHAFQPPLQ